MGVSLVLVRTDLSQLDVPMRHSQAVVGRHTDCKIRLPDGSVSRHHCELTVADGKVVIRDLGSSNGTFVNRRRVTQTELAAGDVVSIGKFVFVVRVDGKPMAVDSEGALAQAVAAPKTAKASAKPAPRAAKDSLLDSDDTNKDDSSLMDFDFLEDDDNAPKL